jgi:hypothetical protein
VDQLKHPVNQQRAKGDPVCRDVVLADAHVHGGGTKTILGER